jgi:two-component system nitrate/nitrite response regulator NarL
MGAAISVVLADDHAIFRAGLTQALAPHADIAVVAQATNAGEAETLVGQLQPDILLLDLWMQRASSIGRIAAILERSARTRIAVLTASEDNQDIAAAMEAGAVAYIMKDTDAQDLVSILRSIHAGQTYVSSQSLAGWLAALRDAREESPARKILAMLTVQERLVLIGVGAGKNNNEIAAELGVATPTVKYHLSKIFAKLGVRNRVEAAVLAKELPSIEPS